MSDSSPVRSSVKTADDSREVTATATPRTPTACSHIIARWRQLYTPNTPIAITSTWFSAHHHYDCQHYSDCSALPLTALRSLLNLRAAAGQPATQHACRLLNSTVRRDFTAYGISASVRDSCAMGWTFKWKKNKKSSCCCDSRSYCVGNFDRLKYYKTMSRDLVVRRVSIM